MNQLFRRPPTFTRHTARHARHANSYASTTRSSVYKYITLRDVRLPYASEARRSTASQEDIGTEDIEKSLRNMCCEGVTVVRAANALRAGMLVV